MYLYAAILAAGLLSGFAGAWKVQDWRHDAAELERSKVESRDRLKKMERGDDAAQAHEATKAKEEIRYVYRTKIVDRIVADPRYAQSCFDDSGMRLLNDAIAGREPAGEPAPAVPRPAEPSR
jgi:outer membrane murein-binding lipoprotein Lpp